jgi:hypothetical protein
MTAVAAMQQQQRAIHLRHTEGHEPAGGIVR